MVSLEGRSEQFGAASGLVYSSGVKLGSCYCRFMMSLGSSLGMIVIGSNYILDGVWLGSVIIGSG